MPRSGGIYTLPPIYKAETGETIMPDQHNTPLEDVAQALTGSLPTDGSAPMQGNIVMGGNKITGLAVGTNPSDAVRLDQLPAVVSSPWLTSLGSITFSTNQMPYAVDATTAAATGLTPFARTILDDVDAPAVRATLGLGAMATKASVAVSDIVATGTPSANSVLYGNSNWGASPASIANGAPGAPRIALEARKKSSAWIEATSSNVATITGIGDLGFITFGCRFVTSDVSGNIAQVSVSTDGGATWGGFWGLFNLLQNGRSGGIFTYQRDTGFIDTVVHNGSAATVTSSVSVGSGVNAIRIRNAVAGTAGSLTAFTILDTSGTV